MSDDSSRDRNLTLAWPPFIVKIGVQRVGTHFLYRPRPIRAPVANNNVDEDARSPARADPSANENVG